MTLVIREMEARDYDRGRGIGRALHCHLFVHVDNAPGERFWTAPGWRARPDIRIMSGDTSAPLRVV
jgi:hypothetical protein